MSGGKARSKEGRYCRPETIQSDGVVWYSKKYPKSTFKYPGKVRARLESITANLALIEPPLTILETDEFSIVRQKKCVGTKVDGLSKELIYRLAEQIDSWHQAGFIHGDLSISNIFVSDEYRLEIIDWEPALEIVVDDQTQLRSTPYCIHPDDHQQTIVTFSSDYFALVTYCLLYSKGRHFLSRMAMDHGFRKEMGMETERFSSAYELVSSFV